MARKIIIILAVLLCSCEKNQECYDIFLKFFGDAYEDIGYSVVKAGDAYLVAGQFTEIIRETDYITGSTARFGIFKTSFDGELKWNSFMPDTLEGAASKIISLDNGSAVAIGHVKSSKTGEDLFIAEIDQEGAVSRQKIFQEKGNQYGTDVLKTPAGYLVLCATDVKGTGQAEDIANVEGKKDVLLILTDENLNKIGSLQRGFPGNDEPVAIKAVSGGGFMIVGTTDRSPEAGQGGANIFLLPVNDYLIPTEFRIMGGTADEYAADFEVLQDGYLIAGTRGSASSRTGYIWKLPEDIYSEDIIEHAVSGLENVSSFSINAISRYKNSTLLMAGQEGSVSSGNMLVFVTDMDGNYIKGKLKIAGGTGLQVAYDVLTDGGDILAVGSSTYEKNSMISLFKFRF